MSGPEGAIARLRGIPRRPARSSSTSTTPTRRLLADSPERAELERAGWEVAYDGMELKL